jgi:GT2 family glycosyltransferase
VRDLDLSVVVVNYNSWPDVRRLAIALRASEGCSSGRVELVIVDNASAEPPPRDLDRQDPMIRLVLCSENGGFSAGVNAGWRAARGRWLLLLNPDVVAGPELIDGVLNRIAALAARGEPAPGIVGFALENPDGTPQPSVGAEPSLVRTLCEPFLPRSRRKYRTIGRVRAGAVPWVTGACALVDRQVLDALSGMDEDFFLYYEEVALCRSSRALGRRVEFDPSLAVVHLRPLQNRSISPGMRVITRHSRLVFFRKHQSAWQFRTMAALTWLEAVIRGLGATCGRRREESQAWRVVRAMAETMSRGIWLDGRAARDLASGLGRAGSAGPPPDRSRRTEPVGTTSGRRS